MVILVISPLCAIRNMPHLCNKFLSMACYLPPHLLLKMADSDTVRTFILLLNRSLIQNRFETIIVRPFVPRTTRFHESYEGQIFVTIRSCSSRGWWGSRDTRTVFRGKVQSPATGPVEGQRNRIGELDETFPFRLNWRLRD